MKRSRLILLLFSLFLLSQPLTGQELSKSGGNIKGGFRVGLVASQISGDDLAGYHKLGAYAGLFANTPISLSGKWRFQMELNFVMKGSQTFAYTREDGSLNDVYKLTLLYTETPFLFQRELGYFISPKNKTYTFFFEVGPALNFLFYQKERDMYGEIYRSHDQLFNFWEAAVIAGLFCRIEDRWGLSFRWSSSVYPVRIQNWVFNRRIKMQFNDYIALTVQYHF